LGYVLWCGVEHFAEESEAAEVSLGGDDFLVVLEPQVDFGILFELVVL